MFSLFTRTLNPLHFEDLEPHRFEDLVRQLAYGFKDWKSIEALGRSGSDDGIDIRATELMNLLENADMDSEGGDISGVAGKNEREWIIQCKREKSINPAKVKKIISESFPAGHQQTYGFILAAACDLSKKAREMFREELNNLGIQEFYLWGKAELEDMLFQPQNDNLLFAYFGISLRVKRKSLRTTLRSRLAIKKKLSAVVGEAGKEVYAPIMLRNAFAEDYPEIRDKAKFEKEPEWRYFICLGQLYPDHLVFVTRHHYAYIGDDEKQWDALLGDHQDLARHSYYPIWGMGEEYDRGFDPKTFELWDAIPSPNKAHIYEHGLIHFDRIIAIDEEGDAFHRGPHILLDPSGNNDFFDWCVSVVEIGSGYSTRQISIEEKNRIKYFPDQE